MIKTVGIIGGGQLARMLALAGYPLGLRFRVYDPNPAACAGQLAPLTVGAFDDTEALRRFAQGVDVMTFDFENVPAASLRAMAEQVLVAPNPRVLEAAQDRVTEKTVAGELGIPCGEWWSIDGREQLRQVLDGRPGGYVLKTRRFGYDGKGQVRIDAQSCPDAAWTLAEQQPCLLEALIPFDRELSILGTRAPSGEICYYPLSENRHVAGILRTTLAPAADVGPVEAAAQGYLAAVMEHFDYVGTLAIEFFQIGDRLLFNEMAPRVHNSGHWTIEGAACSQFENHLRAICGLPLGDARARFRCRMENCVGQMPALPDLADQYNLHFHDYGKEPRLGRKLGHLNFILQPLSNGPE